MRRLPLVVFLAWLAVPAATASAEMTLQSYEALKHDRYYTGGDKAFIGDPYDWSGVGREAVSGDTKLGWATMISPHYFLSANHNSFHPAVGDTVRFYETNDPLGSYEDHVVESGQRIGVTDLWLGRLESAVTNVATYPILDLPGYSAYEDRTIYTYGKSNTSPPETNVRLGRNTIDPGSIALRSKDPPPAEEWMTFQFDFDDPGGVGADESYLQSGDSGGPSFCIVDGAPALVGIHWAIASVGKFSYDTFVPEYIDELNAAMVGEQVVLIPEPSMLVMLLGLGAGCLVRRRRRRAA